MRLLPLSTIETTLGYRYRLSSKRFPALYKKVVTEPVMNISTNLWLKLLCKGRYIQTQKDMSKLLKRITKAHTDIVSKVKIGNRYSLFRVDPASIPQIIFWAVRFLPTLDEVNLQALANFLLRLKLNNEALYNFTCKQIHLNAQGMEYTRLLHSALSLSKLYSIYKFNSIYLNPIMISAAERLVKEEITGMHLGLLSQSLYYSKLFSREFVELILPVANKFLAENSLSPENINSIFGYISLYEGSGDAIKTCVRAFMTYLESSKVDSKNIYKFLKIRHNSNNIHLKSICSGIIAAGIEEFHPTEILDLLHLYTNKDYRSISVLTAMANRLDNIIHAVNGADLLKLLYYICKLHIIDAGYILFKRHLMLVISKAISNIYTHGLDISIINKYIEILTRIDSKCRLIATMKKIVNNN